MPSLRFANVSVIAVLCCGAFACQPTIDLGGRYEPIDYPWSGPGSIDGTTDFPSPLFTGTFSVYLAFEYIDIPVLGIIDSQNKLTFMPYHGDPLIVGLCMCQGFDDGSSIYSGSGEIPDDGIGDRLACSTYLGQPFDPPVDLFKKDW
jgi:hypothetical protein